MSITTNGPTLVEIASPTSLVNTPMVRFPRIDRNHIDQDEEWCEVYVDGDWMRLRLHDYADIYRQPGLYEHIFENLLECTSPQRVISLFSDVLREDGERPTACSAIDLGAGNGMVGEQMRGIGVRRLVGVDIIPEAADAAHRDRPGLYDDYVVADLCNPSPSDRKRLEKHQPDSLVTVSALGFGDIPPQAFWTALSAIQTPGWVAFNIKASFLAGDDSSGFCRLIRALFERGIMQLQASRRYSHRLNVQGERKYYVAMVAKKMAKLPEDLFADL
jgi:predicted TPR repeat methyltransferase